MNAGGRHLATAQPLVRRTDGDRSGGRVEMSKVQVLRALVNQRLSAAAEEIFGLFERTIAEYEEEIGRQRSLLRGAGSPGCGRPGCGTAAFPTNFTDFTADEEVPPVQQQQRSSRPDPEDPEDPQDPEERYELSSFREESDADITGSPSAPLKTEGEEEEEEEDDEDDDEDGDDDDGGEESSEAEHFKMGADHDHEAGSSDPDRRLHPETEDDLLQTRAPQSGSNALAMNERSESSVAGRGAADGSFACCECGERFCSEERLRVHARRHAGEKTFTCPFCGKKFTKSSNLTTHLRVHTGEKPFTCSVCNTSFSLRCTLVNHMRVHTGEKPFSCAVCGKSFSKKANLTTHMALHTEEKPFHCGACGKRFTWHSQVKNHKCVFDGGR